MTKIKVLEIIRQGAIGGGESHLIDLIEGFDKDVEPIVITFSEGHMIDYLTEKNIKCYVIKSRLPFDFTIQRKVIDIIRKENIQIIHAHGTKATSSIIIPSIITRKPLIYTVHGWSFHDNLSPFINGLRKIIEKVICNLCKQVICVSESNKQSGIINFGLSDKAIVIENGINLEKYNPQNKYKDIRKEFGFDNDDFIISFIGRITKQKSPYDFIDSVVKAHEKNKNIKGLMIGDGDMRKEIENYINENSYNDIILLQHFRNDIPDILNSVNVFSLLSLWEGLSIALLEAMAMKKAIVITPTDGTRDLIEDHVNGIIVPFSSPHDAANAYLELENNREKIKYYVDNSYRQIEKRFDSKRVSDSVSNIYMNFLNK